MPTRDRLDQLLECLAALDANRRRASRSSSSTTARARPQSPPRRRRSRARGAVGAGRGTGTGGGPQPRRRPAARRGPLLHRRRLPARARLAGGALAARSTPAPTPSPGRRAPRGHATRGRAVADDHQPPLGRLGRPGRDVAFAPTSNLACRAELHRALPFDERFPLAAGEDRDWCAAWLAGARASPSCPTAARAATTAPDAGPLLAAARRYGRAPAGIARVGPAATGLPPARFYAPRARRGSRRVRRSACSCCSPSGHGGGRGARARRGRLRRRLAVEQGLARHVRRRRAPPTAAAVAAMSSRRAGRLGRTGCDGRARPAPTRRPRCGCRTARCRRRGAAPCRTARSARPRTLVAGRSVQRTMRSGRRSARAPDAEPVGDPLDGLARRACRRGLGTCSSPSAISSISAVGLRRDRRCRRARGPAG